METNITRGGFGNRRIHLDLAEEFRLSRYIEIFATHRRIQNTRGCSYSRITSNALFIAKRRSRIMDGEARFPFIGCVQLRMEYT